MKKIFNKEKLGFIIIIVIQFLLSILVFLNYLPIQPIINIEKEVMYSSLIVVIIIINMLSLFAFMDRVYSKTKRISVKINSLLNNNIKDVYMFGEIGIIFYDENFEVVWVNEYIEKNRLDLIGKNILKHNPLFVKLIEGKDENYEIELNELLFNCKCINELKMIILKDETKYKKILKKYDTEAAVIVNINIDNYSDVLAILDENKMSELDSRVRNVINEWAKDKRIILRKIRNDAYIAFMQEETYQSILKERFVLVDEVKKIVDEDNNLTISFGVGRGINDYIKLSEMAASAVDVALSRGGDQAVVNTYGKNMEFYGAGSEAKSKRHKVKVKVVAKSLSALIQSSKKILIMGHIEADFDAIGASVGVYSLAKQFKRDAKIVYEDKLVEAKARSAFRQSFEKEEIDEMIISINDALSEIDGETLLILVDVSNPAITMSPKIVEKASRIAVIDHHRPGDKIFSQVFSYQEPAASSACEMVSEIISYSDQKIRIVPEVATLMLTGILLDTNNYKVRTGYRTYEASMILKKYGADNNVATEFLKEEFEEHQLKTKIMANSFIPYYGVVLCIAPEEYIIERTYLAKIAQEILDVKGVKASFVMGFIKTGICGISARSDGSVNVQKIMESIGGGGHFSAAATQIESKDLESVKKELFLKLESYIGDNRIE